jgi:hypothetical protein
MRISRTLPDPSSFYNASFVMAAADTKAPAVSLADVGGHGGPLREERHCNARRNRHMVTVRFSDAGRQIPADAAPPSNPISRRWSLNIAARLSGLWNKAPKSVGRMVYVEIGPHEFRHTIATRVSCKICDKPDFLINGEPSCVSIVLLPPAAGIMSAPSRGEAG